MSNSSNIVSAIQISIHKCPLFEFWDNDYNIKVTFNTFTIIGKHILDNFGFIGNIIKVQVLFLQKFGLFKNDDKSKNLQHYLGLTIE